MTVAFTPIVASLETELRAFYASRNEPLTGADELTINTNSKLVAQRAEPIAEMLRRRLGRADLSGLEILDVGAGFGALALYFAANGAKVRGLDPHEERFVVGQSVARMHGLDVTFEPGYIEDVSYPDASFDAVVMNNSFCYIVDRGDRRQALAQVLRILRPGGVFVARNPNRLYPIDQFTRIPLVQLLPPHAAESVGTRLRGHRSRVRLTTIGGARRELEAAGFRDVESHGYVSRPWTAPLAGLARYHHQAGRRP